MKLTEFIIKAKKNTYASDGEGGEKSLGDNSKEFLFKNKSFLYRDRYFNSKGKFIGEEIVFKSKKPIWGMNYYGKILVNSISNKKVYSFLKKAILKVEKDRPFRGPRKFLEGNFLYFDKSIGTYENFYGKEEIYLNRKKIYELKYHGGIL